MRFSRLAAWFAALLLSPLAAAAAPLDLFTLSGSGLNLSFTVASAPQPASYDPTLGFFLDPLHLTANGRSYTASPADFFIEAVGGGFALQDDADLIEYFSFSGKQLFSGSVKSPIFNQGVFNLQAVFCPGQDPEGPQTCSSLPTYSLTIAPQVAATPEPESLALVSTAVFGVMGLWRRRNVSSHDA